MIRPSGDDRESERNRYNAAARASFRANGVRGDGASSVRPCLRSPYLEYEKAVCRILRPGMRVLEIGSGTGRHSSSLARNGAQLTCSDVAEDALDVLRTRSKLLGFKAETVCAPMESTPFGDSTFDLVASAGSLSYAPAEALDSELARVLKPGGSFVCVDSLNHNPIYRFNRWARWRLLHDRSRSTLNRMPTIERMSRLGDHFESWTLRGFGAYSWAWAPLGGILGESIATKLTDACDRLPGSQRLAFKFVFQAQGLRK